MAVDSDSQVDPRKISGFLCQQRRVLRQSDRVQVYDTKETFVFVLQRNPVAQRAEIVSEMDVACWLRATKDSFRHEFETMSAMDSAYSKKEKVMNEIDDRSDDC